MNAEQLSKMPAEAYQDTHGFYNYVFFGRGDDPDGFWVKLSTGYCSHCNTNNKCEHIKQAYIVAEISAIGAALARIERVRRGLE